MVVEEGSLDRGGDEDDDDEEETEHTQHNEDRQPGHCKSSNVFICFVRLTVNLLYSKIYSLIFFLLFSINILDI